MCQWISPVLWLQRWCKEIYCHLISWQEHPINLKFYFRLVGSSCQLINLKFYFRLIGSSCQLIKWQYISSKNNTTNNNNQTSAKNVQHKTRLGREGDRLEIMQEIEIRPYYKIVCAQTRICLGEWGKQNFLGFCDTKT